LAGTYLYNWSESGVTVTHARVYSRTDNRRLPT